MSRPRKPSPNRASNRPTNRSPRRPPTTGPDELRRRILEHFQTLRVPVLEEELDAALSRAEKEGASRLELLERVLAGPAQRRRERSVERRVREACFPSDATLETFDWKFNEASIDRVQIEELATGEFVRRGDNLVFVGQSGLGKSHLLQGVGRRCCAHGWRVRYTTSADLLRDLGASLADGTTPARIRYWGRFDLLIIDEIGFDKLEREEFPQAPSLLYKIIDQRSRRRSTALATNVDFPAWAEYLDDPPLTMALLDRVVDGAILLKLQGRSYRAHRAKQRTAASSSQAGSCQADATKGRSAKRRPSAQSPDR